MTFTAELQQTAHPRFCETNSYRRFPKYFSEFFVRVLSKIGRTQQACAAFDLATRPEPPIEA